ncbi:MAG: threonine aldolase family protein, partial [Acetobacteraceae bacterium]
MLDRTIDFRSDNVGRASPEILEAIATANHGTDASYGADATSAELERRFSELFETPVKVFPVATGTAANAIGLAAMARPYGGIYCYREAHILTSEGQASEMFSGGARLIGLDGEGFRIATRELEAKLAAAPLGQRHKPQPDAVSVTQASEYGTVYRLDELAELGRITRHYKLRFHMDGARLANALATLGLSPAAMTWRAGVDVLSFGATKNGGLSSDAIVVFDHGLAEGLSYRLRRAGQTWSKMRFQAAQLLAYVEGGLYLRTAAAANALARRLATGLSRIPAVSVIAPVEA